MAELTKLALHYHRPDLSAAGMKLIAQDFLTDLAPYTTDQIADACAAYRRDPECKFFPTPGGLIAKIKTAIDYTPPPRRYSAQQQLEPPRSGRLRSAADIIREHYGDAAARKFEGAKPRHDQ